jgi:uncharacterized membrane protein
MNDAAAVEESAQENVDQSAFFLRPAFVFLIVGFFAGTTLVFLTPPFQAPDEPAHLYRAYQISEGTFVAPALDALPDGAEAGRPPSAMTAGGELPSSLKAIADPFAYLWFHDKQKTSRQQILSQLDVPLRPENRTFIEFANVIYSPVPYAASAPALALGRSLGLSPLRLLYIGRLANLLCFLIVGFISLRILPAFQKPIVLLLCMPMMLFLAGSLSADVITDSLAILFTCMIFRELMRSTTHPLERTRPMEIAAIAIISIALTLAKIAYFPLVGLALLIPAKRLGGRRRYSIFIAAILVLNLAAEFYWASRTAGLNTQVRDVSNPYAQITAPADPHAQLQFVLHHPASFVQIAFGTMYRDVWLMIRSFAGKLGWMDTTVPVPFVLLYLFTLGLSCRPTAGDPRSPWPLWLALVVMLCASSAMAAVALLNYIFWDPVGDRHIDGLQGRYFIPVAAPVLLLISHGLLRNFPKRASGKGRRRSAVVVASFAALSGIITVAVVYHRYY